MTWILIRYSTYPCHSKVSQARQAAGDGGAANHLTTIHKVRYVLYSIVASVFRVCKNVHDSIIGQGPSIATVLGVSHFASRKMFAECTFGRGVVDF